MKRTRRTRKFSKMRVGIDIDGTITALPGLFSILTRALRKAGHEVYVVTFRYKGYRRQTIAELKALGVEYDELVMGGDCVSLDWKTKMVAKYKLDAFFEDCAEVIDDIKASNPMVKTFHVRGFF